MAKPAGARESALFLNHRTERASTGDKSQRRKRARARANDFDDGVVNGERVLIAKPRVEREKGIEIRIRVALSAAGVLVMKHHVDNRSSRTGLGVGVSDLVCVVPPYGRFLGIEIKRPGYSPSDVRDEQKIWLPMVERFGGITGIATSVEEALALVEKARVLS